MHRSLLLLLSIMFSFLAVKAQSTLSPLEQKLTDSICDCINKLDLSTIKDKKAAEAAFGQCFTSNSGTFMQLTIEKKMEMTDKNAMSQLGIQIAKNLVDRNCSAFMKLALAMADKRDLETPATGTTEGVFKRIDTKGFNYFVIDDSDKKELSFIWFRHFPGSEEFINQSSRFINKNLKIHWREVEVFIPAAQGYFKIKEVTGIDAE